MISFAKKSLMIGATLALLGAGCSPGSTSTPETTDASSVTPAATTPTTPTPSSSTPTPMTYTFQGVLPAEQIENKRIRITTSKGDIVFDLFADTAPIAVSNFIYLTTNKFYDGLIFHRVVDNFVIQGGDPQGTGRGGPGYKFEDELNDGRTTYSRGIVAMANSGPNTNGSQFFVMLSDYGTTPDVSPSMAKAYTIFGEVVEGMDIVDQIEQGDEMIRVQIETKQ